MISKYFNNDEVMCKCGCKLNNFSQNLVDMLDIAREYAKIPFTVTSGCRCEGHNKAVGGKPESSHTKGLAVDIAAGTSTQRAKVLYALITAGFTRIGIAKTFIHVDIDKDKPPYVTWLY